MGMMYFIEAPIGANVDDVIQFLKNQCQQFTPILGERLSVDFYSQSQGNTISIFTKILELSPDRATSKYLEPDNEFIRFEVSRITDNRSLVKGFYDSISSDAKRMFYIRWTRLGIAFGENWASSAQVTLDEIIAEYDKGFTPFVKYDLINGTLQQVFPLPSSKDNLPITALDQNYDLDTAITSEQPVLTQKIETYIDLVYDYQTCVAKVGQILDKQLSSSAEGAEASSGRYVYRVYRILPSGPHHDGDIEILKWGQYSRVSIISLSAAFLEVAGGWIGQLPRDGSEWLQAREKKIESSVDLPRAANRSLTLVLDKIFEVSPQNVFDMVRGFMGRYKLKSEQYAEKGTIRTINIRTEDGKPAGEILIVPINDVVGKTRIKIGFWDWEAMGEAIASGVHGFATLPNEREIFDSLANYLISIIEPEAQSLATTMANPKLFIPVEQGTTTKPKKQKIRRYQSVHGMLVKIAHRDYWIKRLGKPPNWTTRYEGMIDNKTADGVDNDLSGKIKTKWDDTDVPGNTLAELIFEKYPDFKYLREAWDDLKNKEF
jgi:hypothetical protein